MYWKDSCGAVEYNCLIIVEYQLSLVTMVDPRHDIITRPPVICGASSY